MNPKPFSLLNHFTEPVVRMRTVLDDVLDLHPRRMKKGLLQLGQALHEKGPARNDGRPLFVGTCPRAPRVSRCTKYSPVYGSRQPRKRPRLNVLRRVQLAAVQRAQG